MPEHFSLLVPGAPADSAPMEVDAPWDGSVIASVETTGEAGVECALATAHAFLIGLHALAPPVGQRLRYTKTDIEAPAVVSLYR